MGRRRVLCLVPYPHAGASNRLRIEQYVRHMAERGIDMELSPFLDDAGYAIAYLPGHEAGKAAAVGRGFARRLADVRRARDFDLALVHRETTPFGPLLLERAIAARVPIVYDFDDAIFIRQVHPANRAWSWLRDPDRVAAMAQIATSVIVQNEYLAARAREWNASVHLLPTPVDTERHRPRRGRADGPLVVGWLGSDTTAPYLRLVDGVLARISAERLVKVRIVGGEYRNPGVRELDVVPFTLAREQLDLESFDIGILPEPDDAWTRGKGGYKALLYMAVGIPVVASRVGVNADIVVDGETGFCVAGDGEWISALSRLLDDADLRGRMGAAGRLRVVERYSADVQAPRFGDILEGAMTTGRRSGRRP